MARSSTSSADQPSMIRPASIWPAPYPWLAARALRWRNSSVMVGTTPAYPDPVRLKP